jgi:hypothetical protein
MKLSRRMFTRDLLSSLLTYTLVTTLGKADALATPLRAIVRKWLIDMEEITQTLRQGKIQPVEWQDQIQALLARVELKDLMKAINYEQLAKTAVFPEDHESAEDIDFSHTDGLPTELSSAPYVYAPKKSAAIVPQGHRNMASMHMMLKGQAHIWQFERVSDEAEYLTIKPTIDNVFTVGSVSTISDQRDNIHWFKALSEPVFMFNIGVFGINALKGFTGRDYIDPTGGEKLKGGLIRAKRLNVAEAYKLYGLRA